jgi:hypothetical protein
MTDTLIRDFPRYERKKLAEQVFLRLLEGHIRRGEEANPEYLAKDAFEYVDWFMTEEER